MRHRFVLSALSALLVVAGENGRATPKNDDDDGTSLNSLEDVDLSCDGARCDQHEQNASSTTKKPNAFQLTDESCPGFELPPVFPRQMCASDRECWPRICCRHGGTNGRRYCRIPLPSWRNGLLKTIIKRLGSNRPPYLQCSSPPPERYDLFPRKCRTAVDCPSRADLCCPENGRNVCRPPKAPRRWPRRFH